MVRKLWKTMFARMQTSRSAADRYLAGFCGWIAVFVACSIVATTAAGSEARHSNAVTVFHCPFDKKSDLNYDRWPDHWSRKNGPNHPHYVEIGIHNDATAVNGKCLRIDLDGAAASISSPPVKVLSRFSYVFQAQVNTENVEHSSIQAELRFLDSKGRVIQTSRTKPITTTDGWTALQIGPVEPADRTIDHAILDLHVRRGLKGDLAGRISLADVRLARLPRIAVSTNNPANVYIDLSDVVVRCELSGIPQRDPEIHFQLLDASNNELQSERVQLDGQLIIDESGTTPGGHQAPASYEGSLEWRPNITDYGYYRVAVNMIGANAVTTESSESRHLASRTIYLAVVPPLPMPRHGEFGWTLPQGDNPLSFHDLSQLLPQVGINWLKLPVWFDANEPRRGDAIIRFVERMGASNIEVVGIIDNPPQSSELGERVGAKTPIAELLSLDSATWVPALEPVMTRLSLRVRWWQLGRDFDTSFVGLPDLETRIEALRSTLFRFGQDVQLGLNCIENDSDSTHGPTVTWEFAQQCSDSPATEMTLSKQLDKPKKTSVQRWIFVEPPPRNEEDDQQPGLSLDERAGEFVRRLVAAKMHGADAIIMPKPFSDENGLMRSSGMPAEMLLPWRTTAALLSDAEYLGQMQLPAGSENRIFLRSDGQVVMVIWNPEPVQEVLFLGEGARQFDMVGRSKTLLQQGREQAVDVSQQPSFLVGLNEYVTRWRMSVKFEKLQVPSVFKTPHSNSLSFKNFFPQGVGGSLKIVVVPDRELGDPIGDALGGIDVSPFTPDRWTIEPPQSNIQLAADQQMEFPFEVWLKNALFGKQPIRVDFKVEAQEQFEFSVYAEMEVGTEDLTLEVNSLVDTDGTLIVEQLMTNTADRLADLKCHLYAKGRRPERMQVYRLGPATDRKVYRFANGEDLVGQEMLLEIEELNGPRVLRYRFVATPKPNETVPDANAEEVDAGAKQAADGDTRFVTSG